MLFVTNTINTEELNEVNNFFNEFEAVKTVDPANPHDYLFYAKWELIVNTITLADTSETIEYTYFDEFDLPTRTKTGWKFLGWAIVDENGEEIPGVEVTERPAKFVVEV